MGAPRAEAAGWDALLLGYSLGHGPVGDARACAVKTERVRLGTIIITPVSRRRPWKLSAEIATLDQLSNGRAILTAGLARWDTGFENFGEATDRKVRAELLDDGLEIINGLWQGQPYSFTGKHYRLTPTTFPAPKPPVQQPRPPIWVVGVWPRPLSVQRAARWDGILPNKMTGPGQFEEMAPADLLELKAYLAENRPAGVPFDIVMEGVTAGDRADRGADKVRPLAEAGATWWLELQWSTPDLADVLKRLEQGPPRL